MFKTIKDTHAYLTPFNVNVVVYHKNCSDGFGAAYVFWRFFNECGLPQPEFIGMGHTPAGDQTNRVEVLPRLVGKNVVFVDITPADHMFEDAMTLPRRALVLDHHKGVQKTLDDVEAFRAIAQSQVFFDMSRSGAMLAWQYCYTITVAPPKLLLLIEDRDIWAKRYAETDAFVATFYTAVPFEFEAYHRYATDERALDGIITEGKVLLKYQTIELKQSIFPNAVEKKCANLNVRIINTNVYISDLGNLMVETPMSNGEACDFSVLWYYDHWRDTIKVSLRASGRVDVAEIAKRYGGNGHPNAAGFSITSKSSVVETMNLV